MFTDFACAAGWWLFNLILLALLLLKQLVLLLLSLSLYNKSVLMGPLSITSA
jgi:hypothetical protein